MAKLELETQEESLSKLVAGDIDKSVLSVDSISINHYNDPECSRDKDPNTSAALASRCSPSFDCARASLLSSYADDGGSDRPPDNSMPPPPWSQDQRCDNNQRNKPTYDQQEYTLVGGAASLSRTTCPLNIHEPPPSSVDTAEWQAAVETNNRHKARAIPLDVSPTIITVQARRVYNAKRSSCLGMTTRDEEEDQEEKVEGSSENGASLRRIHAFDLSSKEE
uniref:Uncharacterized protein n=1 Tax=Vespula pensylvanica TaxID=30213 RepID=A0A834NXD7_VESPE|nr:hypothetical protein H0235_010567 [Vespula pensylvanica]